MHTARLPLIPKQSRYEAVEQASLETQPSLPSELPRVGGATLGPVEPPLITSVHWANRLSRPYLSARRAASALCGSGLNPAGPDSRAFSHRSEAKRASKNSSCTPHLQVNRLPGCCSLFVPHRRLSARAGSAFGGKPTCGRQACLRRTGRRHGQRMRSRARLPDSPRTSSPRAVIIAARIAGR